MRRQDAALLDFPDNIEHMKNEERSIRLIGTALYRGFYEDKELRDELNPLVAEMRSCGRSYHSSQSDHFEDAFNSYIVLAYRAARTAEELVRIAEEYRGDLVQYGLLISVQHSFGPTIVFELQNAADLLAMDNVQESLGLSKSVLDDLRDRCFPQLKLARHALAHDAERYMRYVDGRFVDAELPQLRGQHGSRLFGLSTKTFEPLSIDLGSTKIIEFIKGVRHLLDARKARSS